MDVYIQSTIGACDQAIVENLKQEVSVIISPLKITTIENTLKIISGCNLWKACNNKNCQYSLVARENVSYPAKKLKRTVASD